MSESDKDHQLSALFQIKRSEAPTAEFWVRFDSELQRKWIQVRTQPTFFEKIFAWYRMKKVMFASFAVATCALAVMLNFSQLPRSSNIIFQPFTVATNHELPSTTVNVREILELPQNWEHATLAFALPQQNLSRYVYDNIYCSNLGNACSEINF